MTPAARVAAAIELLDAIAGAGRAPADRVADGYFRARRYIGSKDRTAVSGLVYDALRRRAQLDWWLVRRDISKPGTRERVIAALALVEKWPSARIAAAFSGAKFAPSALSRGEARLADWLAKRTLDHPDQPVHVRVNAPQWLTAKIEESFGARAEAELAALLEPAPVDLRANTLKATREEAHTALAAEGIEAEPTKLSPIGLRLAARKPLGATGALRDGLVEVQDEGSQIVALLVGAQPGMRVVDFCAGAGGKALAMAAGMTNQGHVVACDTSRLRLDFAARRLRRAGVHNVERRVLANERDKWVKRHKAVYDRVLIDTPCTGMGAWRRNADARWAVTEADLRELVVKQARILASAARLVKPGGRLVYATCSLLKEENEAQIAAFLAANLDFRLVPIAEAWAETIGGNCPCSGDYLLLTPAHHGTDGFFAAVMARAAPAVAAPANRATQTP